MCARRRRWAGGQALTTTIRKRIAVHDAQDNYLRHATNREAYDDVQAGNAIWTGDKQIRLLPKQMKPNMGATWHVRQSGYCGPLVLQVET